MTNNEKRATEAAEAIALSFSDDMPEDANQDMLQLLRGRFLSELNAAQAEGYKQGAEKMREDAVLLCANHRHGYIRAGNINAASACIENCRGIRRLPITPPQPAAQDDEREMRDAFEKWCDEPAQAAMQEAGFPLTAWAAYQAAWKEKSKPRVHLTLTKRHKK